MIRAYRTRSVDWKPSPVVALATSEDGAKVAAARDDGSLEIWLVSPGSVGWHHQLTIHGDPSSRISSLVWCRAGSKGLPGGRLFSSSIDGSVSEWDLFDLRQKIVLQSIGVSIWQMAVSPINNQPVLSEPRSRHFQNGHIKSDDSEDYDSSEIEDDTDSEEVHGKLANLDRHVAIACDNGAVQMFTISESDGFKYYKSLPRVSGRVLSVTWARDAKRLYSGTSDGIIRCWDAKVGNEIYRSTVGLGGLGSGAELCVWSLLSLSSGILVSADSSGSVQFWSGDNGTLLQAHSSHKGDVYALAASPSDNRVFSAGADGQVILYKLSAEVVGDDETHSSELMKKWAYIGYVRAHTHDVRALTMAIPISREDPSEGEVDIILDRKGKKIKRARSKEKPVEFSYHKWAHLGVPMLISAGDDAKLFAYSANEFTKFSPHDICPAPQRVPIQLAASPSFSNGCLLLVQAPSWLDVVCVRIPDAGSGQYGGFVKTDLLAQVRSKGSRKIICSAISSSGELFAYSDHTRPSLFEISRQAGKSTLAVNKRKLPLQLPSAHAMVFSSDSSRLMVSGHDQRIYVVDLGSSKLLHTFIPCRKEHDEDMQLAPSEPPITKMFTSSDGQWLAAVNCFGDVYIFNLETQRQHWFISRLNGASVTAAGFPPLDNNVLIVTTSLNQVYAFDVEAKQLGEWSRQHMPALPKRYQEFPGEVIGLSFSPSSSSSLSRSPSTIVYSSRAMCSIDFGQPVNKDDELNLMNGQVSELWKSKGTPNAKRKRRLNDGLVESKLIGRKNFEFAAFKDPVLFVGHLSENSILVIDKPWLEVVKGLDTAPIHRHIFGS